jgi:Glycosyl transferase family 2
LSGQQQSQSEKFFWRKDPTKENATTKEPNAETGSKTLALTNELSSSISKEKVPLKSKTLIGIPCHNAEALVGRTIVQLSQLGDAEILVCDDGSTDATEDIATKMGCRVIKHPRELGRSDAVTSLFLAAKRLKAEVLLTVGTNSQYTLADLAKIVGVVQRGDADLAIGSSYPQEAIDAAHHDGLIKDAESLVRAYGKKALAMIAPLGTNSVVVEKEVLEFADQQGMKVREYATTNSITPSALEAAALARKKSRSQEKHFESRVLEFVSVKHPLIFYGIPALGAFYVAVLETVETTNFTQISVETLEKFGMSLVTSPLTLAAAVLSVGSALLYSLKQTNSSAAEREREGSSW